MKINYVKIKERDVVVSINPAEVKINIELLTIQKYYLTPLQAILLGIVQKYGEENKWVSVPSSINGCFMHLEGVRDINAAFDMLVEKRLLIEGDYSFPCLCGESRIFKLAYIQ